MQIKLYGVFAERAGKKNIEIDEVLTAGQLKEIIGKKFPDLKGMPFLIAVNKEVAGDSLKLKSTDDIALMPPFAGG